MRSALGERVRLSWPAVAVAALSVAYLVIATRQPIGINAYAPHDDTYFMRSAQQMLDGKWFGPFNQMTLIKGPGFTYLLVANHWLGVPLTLTLAVIFLASVLALVHVLGRAGLTHPWARVALVAALLLQPAVMPVQVIRDALYHSLVLLVLAGTIALISPRRTRWWPVQMVGWGLALGAFWITREEGVWMLPAMAVLVIGHLWRLRRQRAEWLPFVAAGVVLATSAAVPVLATSYVNHREYGTFAVQDFKSPAFQAALASLDGIVVDSDVARFPAPKSALDLAYGVSPTLRTLKPYLEGPQTEGYLTMSCSAVPDGCGSFLGGLFPWAIRDAAAYAGQFTSQKDADRLFSRISTEVQAGCDNGDFSCRTSPLPLVPVLSSDVMREIPSSMWRAIRLTTYGDGAYVPTNASAGTPEEIATFSALVGDPLRTRSTDEGYVPSAGGWSPVKRDLAHVYAVATPVVLVVGLLSFATAVVRRTRSRRGRPDSMLLLVAGGAWVCYLSRIGLVALVDVSSFPAINASYLEPAFLLLYVASAASLAAAVQSLTSSPAPEPAPAEDSPAPDPTPAPTPTQS